MTNEKNLPTFNVKAVSLETGLKPDTLRAWERRYGLPTPSRSDGGHRLYSQHDVDTLKWLVARQEEGLTISNAVELWFHLEQGGDDPLTMPEYRSTSPTRRAEPGVVGETISELRKDWVEACKEFDEVRAERILSQAFALYPVETVVVEIMRGGMADIGEGWYQGDIVVQQEHFASQLGLRRLEALLASTPPASRLERLLMVCPPGELHTFGLLLLNLLIRRRGYPTVYLGANVPIRRLKEAVEAAKPNLVVAVAQLVSSAASLREMGLSLKEQGVPLAYGGRVFSVMPELQRRIPGHYLGDLIREAPDIVESLVAHPRPVPEIEPVPESYERALAAYSEALPLVEHRMAEAVAYAPTPDGGWHAIHGHMAEVISAGLRLGDLTVLDHEQDWVEGLLANLDVDQAQLGSYFEAYRRALDRELGLVAAPVLEWLEHRQS